MPQQVPRCPTVAHATNEERKREGDALWQIDRYGQGNGIHKRKQLFKERGSGQGKRFTKKLHSRKKTVMSSASSQLCPAVKAC